ncbi:S1 family peptidase [Roseibacterium sp. SDUM158016]|uniref:trypsin-like serine peptidase n=1 Tax=Roseicyclus sediminis TaxID=2980997 RepID=UPI0021D026B9|nr:S1 family peptidase [Roseibacterium sp. SDUM158016]MCU4654869.1 S1 family peptidase [Roseibacterium sp. SDUM158016]
MTRAVLCLLALLASVGPVSAGPADPPGLAPRSAEASLAAIGRLRAAHQVRGGCTAVLIAPDLALTAGHCARGEVAGPRAMRLTFRPDSAPPLFAVTVRAVAFHARNSDGPLTPANAPGDIALLRLAMAVPNDIVAPIPLAEEGSDPETVAIYGYPNPTEERLHGHPFCELAELAPGLLGSDCRVVSGLSGSPVLSGRPGEWRVEGITVGAVLGGPTGPGAAFGTPLRAMIADVVPWPDFAGPFALDAPPSAGGQTSP